MAVCEIWDVKGRLDHPLNYAANPKKTTNPKYTKSEIQALCDVMNYAANHEKTERQFFVTGVNCNPSTARDEMLIAKEQWSDESEIVCYHGYQSFKHGEVTPELAHEVGVKLAEKMWGDRFQVIVATHLNTKCLHNHFVVNSVSYIDGLHYHDNKKNLRLLRKRSDELCHEYSLSVIRPDGRKKPYALYQAEKNGLPSRDNVARQAIDNAIAKSFTMKDFDRHMADMGYRIKYNPNRKYWTIIGRGWDRPKRMYKLGDSYTNEKILERIRENSYSVKFTTVTEPKVNRVYNVKKSTKKIGGLRGLYLHYCYLLGILPKRNQNYAELHYLLKEDLMKMDRISEEARLLCHNRIETLEQLISHKELLKHEISELIEKRKELYTKSRSKDSYTSLKQDASIITKKISKIRKDIKLCSDIEVRSKTLKEKVQTVKSEQKVKGQKRKEMMRHEYKR